MTVRARVLCENSVHGNMGARAEHGWSVWLETPVGTFLYDTGQESAFLVNAEYFRVPLGEAQAILISHHHLDHTGGLLNAVRTLSRASGRERVPVYAHPDLFKDSFYESDGKLRFAGLPYTRAMLEMSGAEPALTQGFEALRNGGVAALLGLFKGPINFDMNKLVIFKGCTVLGINGRKMFETWYQMEELLLSGKLELGEIVTHEFPLEQFKKAHETMISGEGIKVVMSVNG